MYSESSLTNTILCTFYKLGLLNWVLFKISSFFAFYITGFWTWIWPKECLRFYASEYFLVFSFADAWLMLLIFLNCISTREAFKYCKCCYQSPVVGDFYGTGIEIWAGFGLKGQLSCLHSFEIFWPMKPPYISKMFLINVAHFDVSKTYKIL